MIWYAAYGSNLLEERFLAYLRGGSVSGSAKVEVGARDSSNPVAVAPYMVPRLLGFGYSSKRWNGGGVCFVDPNRSSPDDSAYGRAWLLTVEQLEDVRAQENGKQSGPAIDVDELLAKGFLSAEGNYGRIELLGELEGHPVATITCDNPPPNNAADESYLLIVGRGLIETWGLTPDKAAAYLASRPGNAGIVQPDDLALRLAAAL